MIALVAIVLLFALAKGGGALSGGGAGVQAKEGALSSLQQPAPGTPLPPPQSSVSLQDKTHAILNKVLPVGAGVVGAAACSYYGLAAAAPVCAKVASTLEKPARKLANFSTGKATDIGGKLLTVQATGLNKLTAGAGAFAAGKVASAADNLYSQTNKLGSFAPLGKAAVLPVKLAADVGAKGAQIVSKGGTAIVSGVKSATSAVSSGVHKVLGFL
jgi:hypothetical protein